MEPESTDPDAPDLLAIATEASTDDLIGELRIVAAYANDPNAALVRQAYLSGLLHGRGIDPNTYTVGAGDSITTAHTEA